MSKRTEGVIFKLEKIAEAESKMAIESAAEGLMGIAAHSALLAAITSEAVAVIKQLDRENRVLKSEEARKKNGSLSAVNQLYRTRNC